MRTLTWTLLLGIIASLPTLAEGQIAIQLSGSNGGGPRPPLATIRRPPWIPLLGNRDGGPAGPIEPMVANSDLVVVAKFVRDDGIHEIEIKSDGPLHAGTWELQRCKFEVGKLLFDHSAGSGAGAAGSKAPAASPKTLSVLTPTQMPPKEIGGTGMHPHIRMMMPAPMVLDKSYVLFLKKLAGSAEYYLVPDSRFEALEQTVKRVDAAAKIDQWPWGKTVGSLQLCLLLPEEVVGMAQDVEKGRGSVPLIAHVALRNTGTKPVRVVLGLDSDVNFKLSGANGREIEEQIFPRATYERELQPGEVAMLGYSANFSSPASLFLRDLAAGPYTFTVRFKSGKAGKAGDWLGELLSGPVLRTVTMRQATPLITRPHQ